MKIKVLFLWVILTLGFVSFEKSFSAQAPTVVGARCLGCPTTCWWKTLEYLVPAVYPLATKWIQGAWILPHWWHYLGQTVGGSALSTGAYFLHEYRDKELKKEGKELHPAVKALPYVGYAWAFVNWSFFMFALAKQTGIPRPVLGGTTVAGVYGV